MVEGLLGALFIIAIICIIVGLVVRLVPMPHPVGPIIWAIAAIICIVLLARGLGIAILGL